MTGKGLRMLALLVAAPLFGCAGIMESVGATMPQELEASGVSAEAEVLEVWDTGWTVNDDPVVGMKVRVHPRNAPAYEATIEKTLVSRIATWQVQPGSVIGVRYDPSNPAVVAVDRSPATGRRAEAKASTGNPFRDQFERVTQVGLAPQPETAPPAVYLGTGDSGSDRQALYENHYSLLGASAVAGGGGLAHAVDYGRELGAALVVLYGGGFETPTGTPLEVLPFRRRGAAAGESAMFTNLGPGDQVAAYWGKTPPPILGVVFRPADAAEQQRIGRGLIVEAVVDGSPAAAAGFAKGDLVTAIEGEPVDDVLAVPARLRELAGKSVRFDLVRDGGALSLTAALNPAG